MHIQSNELTRVPTAGVFSDRLRVHPVMSDTMEPTLLNRRDYVLLAPVSNFVGDGIYAVIDALGVPDLFRVQCLFDGKGSLQLSRDNKRYREHIVSPEQFEDVVIGYVIADIKVKDERFLREAMQ